MSKHKDDMPEDIKRSARKAYDETLVSIVGKDAEDDVIAALERAIVAERQRSADIANGWANDVRNGSEVRIVSSKICAAILTPSTVKTEEA